MLSPFTTRTRLVRNIFLLLALVLAALSLAGCDLTSDKSEIAGPDWSRGRMLGVSGINNRPGIAWDADTQSAILTWLTTQEGQWRLEYVRVNNQGQVADSQILDLGMNKPTRSTVFHDSQDRFHLFWLDTQGSGDRPGIFHAMMSATGDPLSGPQRISGPESDVTGYTVAEAVPGTLDIFWSDVTGGESELYHVRMAASGELTSTPVPVGVAGEHPSSAASNDGVIHLAWHATAALGSEQVWYAAFDPETLDLGEPYPIAAFPGGTGQALYTPEIGLDTQRVYIVWSLERRGGGLGAGTATTFYESFPIGHPAAHTGSSLGIPSLARPEYVYSSGAFNYQVLAFRGQGDAATSLDSNYTYMPSIVPGQRDELGIVLSSSMSLPRRSSSIQLVFVVMKDGRLKGFEVAGRTRSASMRPIAVADNQGAVHLAWLDAGGFSIYEVYYASTSQSVRQAVNRLTLEDVLASLAGGTWSAASALAFFPMLIVWLFLPFAWLVGFYLLRPDSDLEARSGRIALTVAIVLYLLSKLFMLPAFLWYAPLLDIISPRFETLVILGFPIAIAAIAFLATRAYVRRADRKVVLVAFAIFAGTDSVLSLLLYMPNAMGG